MGVIILQSNIAEELKNVEMLMLAQFIDVMDIIGNYKKIEDVYIDIEKRKKMYIENIEKLNKDIDFWELNLSKENIEQKIKKLKNICSTTKEKNEICLAYKLGLIDGMKVKNK